MADAAAQAAAAAALAMVANPNKARLTLRSFEGKADPDDARDFIAKVEGYRVIARLTGAETVQSVQFACTPGSIAAHWLATMAEEDPDSVADWNTLLPLFKIRFTPDMTPSQRAAAVDACRQHKTEGVQPFMDRCRATQLILDRSIPAARKTGGARAQHLVTYSGMVLEIFLRGLREEGGLKAAVNGANATTREEYLAAAVRYETHVSRPKNNAVVAEIDQDEDNGEDADDDAEVANLSKAKGNKKNKKKTGGGGQGNKGGNGNAARNNGGGGGQGNQGQGKAQGGDATGGPRLCWSCQSPDHMNYQCPNKKAGGGGNGRGGNRQRGGGGGGAQGGSHAQPALNEVLGQYFLDNFARANLGQQQQNNQGALEALAYQGPSSNYRSDGNPFQGFQ